MLGVNWLASAAMSKVLPLATSDTGSSVLSEVTCSVCQVDVPLKAQ
jgi:hypothetical protein